MFPDCYLMALAGVAAIGWLQLIMKRTTMTAEPSSPGRVAWGYSVLIP